MSLRIFCIIFEFFFFSFSGSNRWMDNTPSPSAPSHLINIYSRDLTYTELLSRSGHSLWLRVRVGTCVEIIEMVRGPIRISRTNTRRKKNAPIYKANCRIVRWHCANSNAWHKTIKILIIELRSKWLAARLMVKQIVCQLWEYLL